MFHRIKDVMVTTPKIPPITRSMATAYHVLPTGFTGESSITPEEIRYGTNASRL